MINYDIHAPEKREMTADDMEAVRSFVPMSFKEYFVSLLDDDEVAAQVAAEIGLDK